MKIQEWEILRVNSTVEVSINPLPAIPRSSIERCYPLQIFEELHLSIPFRQSFYTLLCIDYNNS